MRTTLRRALLVNFILSLLLFGSSLAHADTATWDYSAYSKFSDAMFKSGSEPIIYTEDKAPLYVLMRFVVDGSSTEDWTEALEVINTQRKNEPKNARAWYGRFKEHAEETCASDWEVIKESKKTLMFERRAAECPPFEAQQALYCVLYGKRDVFVLIATRKNEMDTATREGWLKLLHSAEITR